MPVETDKYKTEHCPKKERNPEDHIPKRLPAGARLFRFELISRYRPIQHDRSLDSKGSREFLLQLGEHVSTSTACYPRRTPVSVVFRTSAPQMPSFSREMLVHPPPCSSVPSPFPLSEIVDHCRRCLKIVLAPNHQRRIVETGSHIVRARANGHGIGYPVLNSAANRPRVASRPSPEQN
jgi:hypothetical protein